MQKIADGKVVIITGAGRGLGRSHALAFSRAGARVVVNDLGVSYAGEREGETPADSVVNEIVGQGGQAVADANDVADMDGARNLLNTALNAFGKVDILVNNAAIVRPGLLIDTSEEDWDEVIRVDIKGTFCPTRVVAQHWVSEVKDGGYDGAKSIICTTSRVGLRGAPYFGAYGSAKAAVASFLQAAALELEEYGIRVNGIAPRANTRMMNDALKKLNEITEDKGETAVFNTTKSSQSEPRELSEPEYTSSLLVWLSSERATSITGIIASTVKGEISIQKGWEDSEHVLHMENYSFEDLDEFFKAVQK